VFQQIKTAGWGSVHPEKVGRVTDAENQKSNDTFANKVLPGHGWAT
jgi:hypothetical protein